MNFGTLFPCKQKSIMYQKRQKHVSYNNHHVIIIIIVNVIFTSLGHFMLVPRLFGHGVHEVNKQAYTLKIVTMST